MTILLERYDWKRVEVPRPWRPKEPGEELVGFYGGKTIRNGRYGQYEVVIVHVPHRGAAMITGTQIVQLIDASTIAIGWPIRVVWLGAVAISEGRTLKRFDLLIAEGDPIAEGHLPLIKSDAPVEAS